MASIPAHNPPVPFLGLIPGGLSHGRMIRIKGFMKPFGDRFTINLQLGPSTNPLDDVALHIDVRPLEGEIVRNHHTMETGWGIEERFGGCPVQPGQQYEILVLAQHNCFKIAVNGAHFCEFSHRLPLFRVQYLYILNDTDISYIGLEGDCAQQQPIATAPPYHQNSQIIPPPANYVPNYSAPPAYGAPNVIHQQIQPIPPYNPNVQLSYGGVPPPYGTIHHQPLPPAAAPPPYYGAPLTATSPTPPFAMSHQYMGERNKSNNMLKYAAIAGGAGLGGYAFAKMLDSDSD